MADADSLTAAAARAARVASSARASASSAVLVGRSRSATGHPLAVMGPQLDFYYRELFLELDAHGGGIHVRGGALPSVPDVRIGRTRDYAWSATSASGDNTDQFLERLCNPDGSPPTRESTHYRYRGRCRPMTTFDARVLSGAGGGPRSRSPSGRRCTAQSAGRSRWAEGPNWSYQSVHRNELFKGFKRRNRLHDVLGVVNRAATQDLRAVRVWPVINTVLAGGPAPDARSRQAVEVVNAWVNRGASRLDRDLDGKIDDPGAAVLDESWDALSEAVLRPVLGDLAAPGGLLGELRSCDNSPRRSNGSAYGGGWYGYVDKDLRTLLGRPVRGRYSRRYCGAGDLAACRQSLWTVIRQSADALAAAQGPDPAAWRSDATEERIDFQPGLLGPQNTMAWTNRPTLHQLMEFRAHRRLGRRRG